MVKNVIKGGNPLNTRNFMIVDNKLKEVITSKVENIKYNDDKIIITFKNGKPYSYGMKRISILKDPIVLNPYLYRINHNGKELFNISEIYVFQNYQSRYWHICFRDSSERDYNEENLKIYKSCLDDKTNMIVYREG